jgi:hypothetical protein
MKNLTGKIYFSPSDKRKIENIHKNITSLELLFERENCISWISNITSPLPNVRNLFFIINENYIPGVKWIPNGLFYPEIIRNIYPNISEIVIRNHLIHEGCLIGLVNAIFSRNEEKIIHLSIHSFGRFNYEIKGPHYGDIKWSSVDFVTIEGNNHLKDTNFNLPGLKELNLLNLHDHEHVKIVANKIPGVKINNIIN